MYAAMGTRPDIAHAVSVLSSSTRASESNIGLRQNRVLHYHRGTADYTLSYFKDDSPIQRYTEADCGNYTIDTHTRDTHLFSAAPLLHGNHASNEHGPVVHRGRIQSATLSRKPCISGTSSGSLDTLSFSMWFCSTTTMEPIS